MSPQALVDIAKHGHRGVLVSAGLADVFSRVVAIANASARPGLAGAAGGAMRRVARTCAHAVLLSDSLRAGGDDSDVGGGAGRDETVLLTSTGASSLGSGPGLRASPVLRKLAVKLAARTGLAYLPPRVAAWRCAAWPFRPPSPASATASLRHAGTSADSGHFLTIFQLPGSRPLQRRRRQRRSSCRRLPSPPTPPTPLWWTTATRATSPRRWRRSSTCC